MIHLRTLKSLNMDWGADCTGYGLQDLMLLFIFNLVFIKISFPGGQQALGVAGKENETNFLPLPDIRTPKVAAQVLERK